MKYTITSELGSTSWTDDDVNTAAEPTEPRTSEQLTELHEAMRTAGWTPR